MNIENGFVLQNGRYVAIRSVDYTKISVSKTKRTLSKHKLNDKDIEYLKDVLFLLLFDKESSYEKDFMVEVLDHKADGFTFKDPFLITNIKEIINYSSLEDLINNPVVIIEE